MRSKGGRLFLIISGIIVILFTAVVLGWHFFKKDLANPQSKIAKPLLTNELKKLVHDASDGLYHIEYSKFNLDINKGTCLITNFKLIPDSNVFKRLVALHKAPNNVFKAAVDSVVINNFGFVKTKSGRGFNIGNIDMYHPVIKLINKQRTYTDSLSKPPLLLKMAKDILKAINVQNMMVHNMTFTLINQNEKIEKHTALKNLSVYLSGFSIDSLSGKHGVAKTHQVQSDLGMQVNICRISTPDSLYYIYLNGIDLSLQQRDMLISKIAIVPRLSIPAFYKKVRYNKDRFHMVFNGMVMSHINIDEFLKTQQLHIGHISIANSWTEVYNNYNWPKRIPPIRKHGYLHERLQRLAFDVSIDTTVMHKGYTSYKIATKKSGRVADFFLTNTETRLYNITNNTTLKTKKPNATIFMRTRVMGAANLKVNFNFDLNSKNGAMSYSMLMGKMDGRALNPLSVPLALVNVKSAAIEKMYMHVDLNEQFAKGNIDMYYTNMKIDLLKPGNNGDTLKKKKVLSFITNAFLPNDNPGKNGKLREGPIYVTRDPRMSFLGFIYMNMLDGMTSLISGLNQHKDKPNKNTAINIGRKFVKPPKTTKGNHQFVR